MVAREEKIQESSGLDLCDNEYFAACHFRSNKIIFHGCILCVSDTHKIR